MASFRVETAGLAGLAEQVDRLRGDADAGQKYVMSYTDLSYGGLLNEITGSHEQAVESVRDFLDRLAHPVAGNTAQAVRVAGTYYHQTDANAAARLDATYPGAAEGDAEPVDFPYGAAAFRDTAHPQDRYTPPPDRSAEFAYEPTALVLISPAAFGRMMIVEATSLAAKLGLGDPWDPYEALLKPLTGDWNGLRGCTDVFENVAKSLEDMSANLGVAARSVPTCWEGNAAGGVIEHLTRIAEALEQAVHPIEELAKAYEKAAEGAHQLFGTLADILNDLIDAVIIFIAEASAAVATSETVIGGIAFGAAAAFDAYECYKLIKEAIECYTLAYAVMEALQSSLNGFGVVNGDIKLPELEEARPPLPGDQASVGRPSIGPATVPSTPTRPWLGAQTTPGAPQPSPAPGNGPAAGRPGPSSEPSPSPGPQPTYR